MNRQQALRHLLLNHVPPRNVSTKYGVTNLGRSIVAWNTSLNVVNGSKDEVTEELLDEVIKYVDGGMSAIEAFYNGEE